MEQTPEISIDSPGLQLDTVQGDMELRDVTFAYPTRPDVPIFSHFTLFIPAGKTVALVGESGCGKSSVIQLIERFYDPQQGTVLLDGIDIRKLQLSWFRSQLGLVNQEPTLFGTTIRENIRMGNPEASEADIEAAACTANAHIFISQLPLGYDTHVGERGVQISGGQKQRIAIARAIIKNPRVLLLDEATSALDAESEHVVQEALDQLMVGRTTLIVAHRLSTVVHSTSIAVIKNGRIVEQGSHEELMAKNGAYSTLILMQQAQSQLDSSFHLVTTNKAGIVHLQKVPEDDDRQGKMMPSDNVIGGELLSRGGLEGLYGLDLGMSPVAVKPPPVRIPTSV